MQRKIQRMSSKSKKEQAKKSHRFIHYKLFMWIINKVRKKWVNFQFGWKLVLPLTAEGKIIKNICQTLDVRVHDPNYSLYSWRAKMSPFRTDFYCEGSHFCQYLWGLTLKCSQLLKFMTTQKQLKCQIARNQIRNTFMNISSDGSGSSSQK